MIRQTAAVLLVGLIAGVAFGVSYSYQDRPDEPHPPGHSVLWVQVETRTAVTLAALGDQLVGACAYTAPAQRLRARPGGDEIVVESTPALGEHAERRLVGCLGDALFDYVVSEARAVEHRLDGAVRP